MHKHFDQLDMFWHGRHDEQFHVHEKRLHLHTVSSRAHGNGSVDKALTKQDWEPECKFPDSMYIQSLCGSCPVILALRRQRQDRLVRTVNSGFNWQTLPQWIWWRVFKTSYVCLRPLYICMDTNSHIWTISKHSYTHAHHTHKTCKRKYVLQINSQTPSKNGDHWYFPHPKLAGEGLPPCSTVFVQPSPPALLNTQALPDTSFIHTSLSWHMASAWIVSSSTYHPFLARAIPPGIISTCTSKSILTLQVHLDSPRFLSYAL